MKTRELIIGAAITLLSVGMAFGQTGLPMTVEPYDLDLGAHDNTTNQVVLASSGTVVRTDTPWMRVHLGNADLGAHSYVVFTCNLDGQQQALDSATLHDWSNISAAFRGDSVQVDLFVAPGDTGVFANVTAVTVPAIGPGGEPDDAASPHTICGNDDRV